MRRPRLLIDENLSPALPQDRSTPGVVFIVPNVRRPQQIELFAAALQDIAADSDLLNVALDVAYEDDEIVVRRYPLP